MTTPLNPMVLNDTIAIAIGAIVGAITRYQTGRVVTEYISNHVHDVTKQSYYLGWHTAFINITGSFLLGTIVATPSISAGISTSPPPPPSETSSQQSTTSSNQHRKAIISPQQTTLSSPIPTDTASRLRQQRPNATSAILTTAASPSSNSSTLGLTPRLKLLFGVGFCGSYTTFSTYTVDIVSWIMQGQTHKAVSYFAMNNIGGIAAAALGMTVMKKLLAVTSK